ncbi:DNA-binding response regulator [Collimonas arenae]|uniref:DNA-binding response regulator n=1 Tax=Collimonas arenae TaxID=279058 RepID=A0A0A1F4K1_9BURK|nr:response regulator transcription factor [Collimonas arenae]AIY39648.1 DNA-binding response regulator [Collimonas arenae]
MNIACCVPESAEFEQLQAILARAGFDSEQFVSEVRLLHALRRRNFDLIVLDTGHDRLDKDRLLSWLNCRIDERTPVILLSSAPSAEQVALALDVGADDFIGKPFAAIELVARVNALLRRSNRRSVRRTIELLGFALDRSACSFLDNGMPVELTPREFTMAWLFFSTPNTYLSRESISIAIWGVDSDITGRTIEQHIYKLRKKLKLGTERGVIIRTAYTQGYRLEMCA